LKIGRYTVRPVETGTFGLDGGAMFGVVPQTLWKRTNPPDDRNRITLSGRGLLLQDGTNTILVDNGVGPKLNDKLKEIYRLDHSGAALFGSLARLGVDPGEVTHVILTHLHFDHAGGSTVIVDGRPVPAFPNARHYVQGAHWKHANNPNLRDRASFFEADFAPLRAAGLLEFTEGEGEILPGISVLVMNGHTTAQQLPLISGEGQKMLYTADLFPTVAHLPIPWVMGYDLRPLETMAEKERVLELAVSGNWILFFEHDPATVACTLERGERGIGVGKNIPLD
jgi:glyoxylase-like metal-dependent hydrolase (beta-lactamase superfamily II)